MKTRIRIMLAGVALVAAASSVSAQTTITQTRFVEDKLPMELRTVDNQIDVAFDISLGKKFIGANQACVITPIFVYGQYSESLPAIVVEGRNYAIIAREKHRFDGSILPTDAQGAIQTITYKGKDVTLHYMMRVPYKPELKGATLILNYKTYNICGAAISDSDTRLASGVTDYSDFRRQNQVAYYYPDRIEKEYTNNFADRSVFRLNRKTINMDSFVKYGYTDFKAEIQKLLADGNVELKHISVHASASPDGSLERNAELAEARADAIADFLVKDLGIDASLISKEWVDENWAAFQQDLQSGVLSNSIEIGDIISSTLDLDQRENKLRGLSNWREIYNVFQNLRNCDITVTYTTYESYPEEINIDGRNMAIVEMGGEHTTSVNKTLEYYNADPMCLANINNMMVALTEAGRYREALKYADLIPNKGILPVVANNKGVLYTSLEEMAIAKSMFELAGTTPMASYNLGLVYLLQGKYDSAADLLGSYNGVNSTTANLDAKRYEAAASSTYIDNSDAEVLYLRAIAYAKDGMDDLAMDALSKAVSKDSSYKAKALNQSEFLSYRGNARFAEITGSQAPAYDRSLLQTRSSKKAEKCQARESKREARIAARQERWVKRMAKKEGRVEAPATMESSSSVVATPKKATKEEIARATRAQEQRDAAAKKEAARAAQALEKEKAQVAENATKAKDAAAKRAAKAAAVAEKQAAKDAAVAEKEAAEAAANERAAAIKAATDRFKNTAKATNQ